MRNVKDIVLTFLHNLALSLSYCIEVRNFDQRRENLALSMMKPQLMKSSSSFCSGQEQEAESCLRKLVHLGRQF